MSGMAKELKKRAKKVTSTTKSSVVVKTISRKEINELKRRLEPILKQNEQERIASEKAAAGTIWGVRN